MTKVTYLDHSGFVIATPRAILVFDYYRDRRTRSVTNSTDIPTFR